MSQRPLGDMDPEAFRREGHRIVDWLADYLAAPEQHPVLSRSKPGDLVRALPAAAPEDGEPFDAIFADFEQHVVPGLTHWNHPGFFAYFAISASGPGILAEMLSAGLNVQAMLWRTSPAATELEQVTLGWLAQLMGLPSTFEGVIYDTASISTLHALAAAREVVVPDVRARGMLARPGPPGVRVYCSEHTHSSIDKAVLLLGFGQQAIHRIPGDDHYHAMRADHLAEAIADDRRAGFVRSPSSRRSAPRRPPPSILSTPSPTSARPNTSGCTWTPPTPASWRWCRPGASRSRAWSVRTRSSSIRTSGSSRRSI